MIKRKFTTNIKPSCHLQDNNHHKLHASEKKLTPKEKDIKMISLKTPYPTQPHNSNNTRKRRLNDEVKETIKIL